MNLAKNIVKYRQRNHLSQEQLADALNISRQSISKWETGENLPSIDNLISLSGLLDISLDELITGEPYLHFPFNYGKPKNNWPIVALIVVMFLFGLIFINLMGTNGWNSVGLSLISVLVAYVFVIWVGPFDYKRYYSYWTLNKSGISFPTNNQEIYSAGEDLILPILGILNLRRTKFIAYKQIKSIEIALDLYGYNPNKEISTRGGGGFVSASYTENFYLKIITNDQQEVYLNLKQYYYTNSDERQMLPTIVSFLKRKNVDFIDKQSIFKLLMDHNDSLTQALYQLRDQKD